MKQVFTLLVLVAFSIVVQAQREQVVASVEYESFSRRNQTWIKATSDSVIVKTRDNAKFILMNALQWKKITAIVKKIKLSSVPRYQSPSKAREYDGAAHCRISISTKNKKYESQYFDCGQPMKQLQALYGAIEALGSMVEEKGAPYLQPVE